ncbi:hypothetical protein E2562_015338 [Oryza meyeriana var. granulata]|uniref:Cyclin-like domain-containing protein n=1 Tax=Oryza meyeriana var. granulata TaxID=110450 RepID=A0A6G1EJM5_9ORYZ|nr:hypothetical protein E2562_015338 [Oryza meyeriana var. granulata]
MGEGGAGSWYVSREEVERGSPSRRDGFSATKEAELRATYCSFIRDVGLRLHLPQVTIATAMVLCHRFYLRQSHAKNEWQTVATVCVFLASKIEDTPCSLQRVVIVAYETMYRKDCNAAHRIYQKEVLEKQKELILVGETLLLSTIRFDFNIQHPYEPLKLALKNLGIFQMELKQVAVNLINDVLWTTLVVQFKPHYIAAGSLYLAAKFNNVRLPSENGKIKVWWHVFDVAPKQLQANDRAIYGKKPMLHGSCDQATANSNTDGETADNQATANSNSDGESADNQANTNSNSDGESADNKLFGRYYDAYTLFKKKSKQ